LLRRSQTTLAPHNDGLCIDREEEALTKIEPFALERWMTAHELDVEYDIAESGICPLTARELLELLPPEEREARLQRLLDLPLGYSEARGTHELRSLLAGTYADCTPEDILVTTGAIEANFLLFNVLLNPGDHVIAPYPAYQQLYSVPRALGCDVDLWQIRPETGFRYDVDDLERLLRPDTRLIVINAPHNPTGAMLSAEEARRVYDLAESVGAHILSDEAYRWLTIPGGEELPPPMYDLGPLAISVGTLSKPFGLPGLRLGWMAAPGHVATQCWGLRDYVTLSTATRSSSATPGSSPPTWPRRKPGSRNTVTSSPGGRPAPASWPCCTTGCASPRWSWRTSWPRNTASCWPPARPLASSSTCASASGRRRRSLPPALRPPARVLPSCWPAPNVRGRAQHVP
jgi:hypothetical protein